MIEVYSIRLRKTVKAKGIRHGILCDEQEQPGYYVEEGLFAGLLL